VGVVEAYNVNGWGPTSLENVNGASVEVEPLQMTAPVSGVSTLENQIEVQWAALLNTNTGGASITSYNLVWDKATGGTTWYNVLGYEPASLSTSVTLSTDIIAGTTYQFKVRASNVHGWATSFSTITSIKAAQKPSTPDTVTTVIDSTSGGVQITWAAPHDGNQEITEYLIEIRNAVALMTFVWTED
jgi:hypothetical protein